MYAGVGGAALSTTVSGDPWTTQDSAGGTALDLLNEFRLAWTGAIPAGAHLAHIISGASLGGGVAYLGALCDSSWGFAVSGDLDGLSSFPVVQGPFNWDFIVVAHETGHNFNAIHTHEYCPPIDQCAPSGAYGPCQTSQVCQSNGTVMSYCHACAGGVSNITTQFHPSSITAMRAAAEASCMTQLCDGLSLAYVDGTSPGPGSGTSGDPFPTIEDGLCAVNPCNSTELRITAGTYTEELVITQAVVLTPEGGDVVVTP